MYTIACLCAQSRVTFCDPMDCNAPGSCVHRISQTRILEWVAISSFRGSSQPGIKPTSPALAGRFFATEPSRTHPALYYGHILDRGSEISLGLCLTMSSTFRTSFTRT